MMAPETRKRISAALMGRQLTPEHRAALAAAKRGKPRSPAVKAKISASLSNRPDLRGTRGLFVCLTAAEEAEYRFLTKRKGLRRREALEVIGRLDLVEWTAADPARAEGKPRKS